MAITTPTANLYLDKRTKKKKTGKHPVKITIYYLGIKKRYSIPHSFTVDEWEKLNSPKLRDENLKEEKIKLQYYVGEKFEQALKKIDGEFDFDKFEAIYFENNKTKLVGKDAYSLFKQYIAKHEESDGVGSAQIYQTALSTFQRFRKTLSLNDITPDFLESYQDYMLKDGKSVNYTSMNLRCIRTICNLALAKGMISNEKYPFSKLRNDNKFRIKKGETHKRALTIEELRLLKNYNPKTIAERRAFLYWWFSFYGNGLNMKDVCLLKYKNFVGDKVLIIRSKTENTTQSKKSIEFKISKEISAIIDEIGNQDKSPDAFVFNVLKHGLSAQEIRKHVQYHTHVVNNHMKKIGEELKIKHVITTYTARHSFSTYLKREGVSIEVIGEALGHSTTETTQTYLGSFNDETLVKTAELLSKI